MATVEKFLIMVSDCNHGDLTPEKYLAVYGEEISQYTKVGLYVVCDFIDYFNPVVTRHIFFFGKFYYMAVTELHGKECARCYGSTYAAVDYSLSHIKISAPTEWRAIKVETFDVKQPIVKGNFTVKWIDGKWQKISNTARNPKWQALQLVY